MFRWIYRLIQLAFLLIAVALFFNFRYQGKPAREYGWEYGTQAYYYITQKAQELTGRDIEDFKPKSLSEIPDKLKELVGEGKSSLPKLELKPSNPPSEIPEKKKEEVKASSKTETRSFTSPPTSDHLTEKDRENLNKLMLQKSKQEK